MNEVNDGPALSVILATSGRFANIAATVHHLARQTVAARIELVVLAPDVSDFGLPPEVRAAFHGAQLLGLGRLTNVAHANAAGVRHATAPVVVFAEDHAYPEPEWAEALLARHDEGWAVVGPVVRNGNPGTTASWADYIPGYGLWPFGCRGGPVSLLPGHNSSYKRVLLLAEGEKLEEKLEAEAAFHEELAARGEGLFLEDRAVISHLSFASWRPLLTAQFHHARLYAARRRERWNAWRARGYALGSFILPFLRLARLLRKNVSFPARPSRTRIIAGIFLTLTVDAAGQAVGYLTGPGHAVEHLTGYEYDRGRYDEGTGRPAAFS